MKVVRELVGVRVICIIKKTVLTAVVLMGFSIIVQSQELSSTIIERQNELQEIELNFFKAISEIDEKEKLLVHSHDSICQAIELKLSGDNEKKLFKRLSKKERIELSEQLETQHNIINTIKQLNMVTRQELAKKFEAKLNEQLSLYDSQ